MEKILNTKEIVKKLGELDDDALYEPNEIIKRGLIIDTKAKPSVFKLYRLIKHGTLESINLGSGKAPRYFVKGRELKRFIKERYQV